jgi:Polysaccharide pyruvyl transferase
MRQLLLRARKDAFDVVTAEETLVGNLIAGNAGNLIFSGAAQRILATRSTTVTVDRFDHDPGRAGEINERYDAYVVPLANAFRPSFEPTLRRLTGLITRLRIPVVVLGVGSQADVENRTARLDAMEPAVRAFVDAVLDRSPSIGVRGELTADYLRGLGYRDVEVIGCPSLFLHGDRLRVEKRRAALGPDARIAINVSPYVKATGPIVMHHLARYADLAYVAQDRDTLELLLWGRGDEDVPAAEPRPIHLAHPLFRQGKVRFFVDPWPWFDFLRGMDFSFGTRIHGNIAALIAGTPAVVLAHDSRTLELARYFQIPHRLIRDLPPDVDAADLYDAADFRGFNDGHAARWATFAGFLARHGLEHAFEAGETEPSFEARVAATPYPPAVTVADRTEPTGLRGRFRRMRHRAGRWLRSGRARQIRVAAARARGRGSASG